MYLSLPYSIFNFSPSILLKNIQRIYRVFFLALIVFHGILLADSIPSYSAQSQKLQTNSALKPKSHTKPLSLKINISSQVSASEITIGDQFTYTLVVEAPLEGYLELPALLGNLGQFEVKDFQQPPSEKKGNRQYQTYKLILSTFTVGDYVIPPQWVEYTSDSLTSPIRAYSEPIKITVKRTSAETEKDIAELDPLAPPSSLPWWIYLLGTLLSIGVLAFLGWLLYRRKKSIPLPILSPWEMFSKNFNELHTQQANYSDQKIALYLSEYLRLYIEATTGLPVQKTTTEEFLLLIKKHYQSNPPPFLFEDFCSQTDPVKWAGQKFNDQQRIEIFNLCKQTALWIKENLLNSEQSPIPTLEQNTSAPSIQQKKEESHNSTNMQLQEPSNIHNTPTQTDPSVQNSQHRSQESSL